MDINEEVIEKINRKSLGEDCWVPIGDEIKIKIDYLTRAQELEFNRLSLAWGMKQGNKVHSHHLEYYFRCTVKDIQGITIQGKETVLTFKDGLAQNLVTTDMKEVDRKPLDVVACFLGLGIFGVACGMIYQRIEMTEADKKKLQSALDSVKQENSQESEASSNHAPSLIPGKTKKSSASHSKKS